MTPTPAQLLGKDLHERLSRRLERYPVVDARFPEETFLETVAYWEARSTFIERNQCSVEGRNCPQERNDCVGRCYLDYWVEHQEMAGEAMSYVAKLIGDEENIRLYQQIGRLHDIDYLCHPHDIGNPHESCHPVPLVEYLVRKSFPVPGCIAILEHAPYLDLGRHVDTFTRRLSLALSICEDAVTLRATNLYQRDKEHLPNDIRSILDAISLPKHMVDVGIDRGRYSGLPIGISKNHVALMALRMAATAP